MNAARFAHRSLTCAALIGWLAACTTLDPNARVPDEHIVMVNYRGNPVDPTDHPVLGIGHYREVSEPEFEKQLGRVIGHVDTYAHGFTTAPAAAAQSRGLTDVSQARESQQALVRELVAKGEPPVASAESTPHPRVVVFIHGGLNTQAGSVARAVELHRKILDDGVYPVFVNWQSSLFSSYWDHLFLVRYGQEHPWLAWLTAPFVIGADLIRAIGRAPLTIYNEIESAFKSSNFYSSDNQRKGKQLAIDAAKTMDVDFPEAHRDPGTGVLVFTRDVVLMIPHMVLGILLDIGGTSSWEEMHRRTTLIMEPEKAYRTSTVAPAPPAAVPRLFIELRQLQDELKRDGVELQIDIISHSMGCIIANLLLDDVRWKNPSGADAVHALPVFTNIVYMADADTVQSTERAVYSYMQAAGHEQTNFFTLSLNDRAEVAETTGWYLAPKGSLLVWIDHFFAATPSMVDQRAGKLANQLFSMHRIPATLRPRVHVKSFRFETDDRKVNPVEHGDFSDGKFWRPEYFTPRRG